MNQNTIFRRTYLSVNPSTKKKEVKKEEAIQMSDLKIGDNLSIKISATSGNAVAEIVRVILSEE